MAETKTKNVKVKLIKAGAYAKKIRKIDEQGISFNSKDVEDEFHNITGIHDILPAPFNPKWLKLLVTHNNTLSQAISAMEINIDGSGFVIEAREELEEDDTTLDSQIETVEQFFEEVSPNVSFLTLRRKLRRDLESVGYGFIEVIRNSIQEVVALKRVDPTTIRLLKLRDRVLVDKTLIRGGKELVIQMWLRERRYLQIVGQQRTYFSEFQASRKLNKNTGAWEGEKDSVVEMKDQASELMYFTVETEANGPYGIPRWINNLPSVLGSRKAEEENLTFFDNGGVPPVIITVMGGRLVGDVKKQLDNFLSGKSPNTRIAVLEAQDADSTIDGTTSKLKLDVQRFGSEKMNDSLFENYDEKCSERVRSSFRLAPLFIGKIKDFNLATAMTSYMVTESQVFQPERVEFDEVMTKFMATELSAPELKFRSLPITLKDTKIQWDALKFAFKEGTIDTKQFLKALNSISALGLTFDEALEQERQDEKERQREQQARVADQNSGFPPAKEPAKPNDKGKTPPKGKDKPKDKDKDKGDISSGDLDSGGKLVPEKNKDKEKKYTITKDSIEDVTALIKVANDLVILIGGDGDTTMDPDFEVNAQKAYADLQAVDQRFVKDLVSFKVFSNTELDPEGAKELIDGCLHTLDNGEEHGSD